MTPHYFGECFGWLHHAAGGRGVVLCPAFGVEELVTHRFLRRLATDLAAAGMPALRFDYHGTGNSLGSDYDPDRVNAWLSSVRQAVECLRRETGVREVALVGFRLGALLATTAAAELGDISKLALVGPVISGKTYVRELKALSTLSEESAGIAKGDASTFASDADGIEVTGFTLTRETLDSLQRINLSALQNKPASSVLVLGRDKVAADSRLVEHLRGLGCTVGHEVLPGYAEMAWNSSIAELPEDAFSSLIRWLAQDMPAQTAVPPHPLPSSLRTADWMEEAVRFGRNEGLFGVRCLPSSPRHEHVVLFVNHGADHHIGWARMHVAFARKFAADGIASFRIDVAGLGDSPARPGEQENRLYRSESTEDVSAAVDWLQQQGYSKFIVIGHCAGSYLAFYSALRDPRIGGLVMVNLQRFFWQEGDSLEVAFRKRYRSTDWYFHMLHDSQVWRRILRGEVDVRGIGWALAKQLTKRGKSVLSRGLARVSGTESNSQKVVRWFRELAQRGTRVLLIYSEEDVGLDELILHCGARAKRITTQSNIQLQILDGADHNITPQWARERYFGLLTSYLNAVSSGR